jgi:hypothetical protein
MSNHANRQRQPRTEGQQSGDNREAKELFQIIALSVVHEPLQMDQTYRFVRANKLCVGDGLTVPVEDAEEADDAEESSSS